MTELNRLNAPLPKDSITFHLPKINKFKLANGTDVVFVRKENLPIIQLNILIDTGGKFDPENKKGLAYLTSRVIDEGAGKYTSLELDNEIESLGSVFDISCDHDSFMLSMLSLKENFERSMELLSDVVLRPHFTDEDFLREKKETINKIIQLKDDPSYIASTAFEKVIYGNTPYSFPIMGDEDQIASISNDDIKDYYKTHFTADASTFIVVGNIEQQELTDVLNKKFGGWRSNGKNKLDIQFPEHEERTFYFIHKTGAAQSELRVGHISTGRNTEDFFAKTIMNTILGGQFSSRINLNLRENKGFTYGARSSFDFNKVKGYFEISTAVQSENTGAALTEIIKEIDLIKADIKQSELDFARSYLIKRYPALFETYSQVARNLNTMIIYSLADNYFDKYIEQIENASLEQVKAAAINNIFENKLNILVVGDRDIIKKQLEEIAGKTVIIELDINGNVVKN